MLACRSKGVWVSLVAVLVWLGACQGQPAEPRADHPDREPSRETIRVGTEASFPPFNDRDEAGQPVGLELDLIRAAAREAGYEAEIVVEPAFPDLFRGVDAGRLDVIASTVSVTAQRREKYLFTRPYFETGVAAIVRASDEHAQRPDDLRGEALAAPEGTTAASTADSLGASSIALVRLSGEAIDLLMQGRVRAYLIDEVEARQLVAGDARLRMLETLLTRERYAFLVAPDRRELHARLDAALGELESRGARQWEAIRAAGGR